MNLKINIPKEKHPTFFSSGVAFSYTGNKTLIQTMKFEIEKAKDETFTTRIKVNGKVTFSNGGLNTKQAAYKKLIGLYKGILNSVNITEMRIGKTKGKASIVVIEDNEYYIPVTEINC